MHAVRDADKAALEEKNMHPTPTRREFMVALGLAGAALAVPATGSIATARPRRAAAARSIRVAHLTDIHVKPEMRAGEGLAACLRHVRGLPDRPGLVLTGGDLVFDIFEQNFDRSKALWELFTRSFKDGCDIPVRHCLGNHDIWGWNKAKSGTTGTEKGWGKAWACEALGMARPYHSFDQAGWHFVVLDSVQPGQEGAQYAYVGGLDAEQMAWLDADLGATPKSTPVLVVSHIPILSMAALMSGKKPGENLEVRESMFMTDSVALHKLFVKHGNVKLCLSGHVHQQDRIDYDGVSYICDGAVCGGWWKGPNGRCVEGYGVLDLFDDGTFKHEYVTYGWEAEK